MIKSDLVRIDGKLMARLRYIGTRIICNLIIDVFDRDDNKIGERIERIVLPVQYDKESADMWMYTDIERIMRRRGYTVDDYRVQDNSIEYETQCTQTEYKTPIMVRGHFDNVGEQGL